MRKVVCNTTPLLSLLKIDRLGVLKELYGQITIPEAVVGEVDAGRDREYHIDLRTLDRIRIVPIRSASARLFLFDLDDGEAETIILAQEQSADLAIIDEKLGRRYAAQLGIPVTGTIGVLLKAKERGLIPAVAPLLLELRDKSSWIDDALFEKALVIAGERTS